MTLLLCYFTKFGFDPRKKCFLAASFEEVVTYIGIYKDRARYYIYYLYILFIYIIYIYYFIYYITMKDKIEKEIR